MSEAVLAFPARGQQECISAAFGDAMRVAKSVVRKAILSYAPHFPNCEVGIVYLDGVKFQNISAISIHGLEGMGDCILLSFTGELYRCPKVRVQGKSGIAEIRPNWSLREESPAVWAAYGVLALDRVVAMFCE